MFNICVWVGEVVEKMKGCELGEFILVNNYFDIIVEVNVVIVIVFEV